MTGRACARCRCAVKFRQIPSRPLAGWTPAGPRQALRWPGLAVPAKPTGLAGGRGGVPRARRGHLGCGTFAERGVWRGGSGWAATRNPFGRPQCSCEKGVNMPWLRSALRPAVQVKTLSDPTHRNETERIEATRAGVRPTNAIALKFHDATHQSSF